MIESAAFARAMRQDDVVGQVARALMMPAQRLPDNSLMIQQLAPAIRAGDQVAGRVAQGARGLLSMFGTAAAGQMAQP
jgi:hypothetical protein